MIPQKMTECQLNKEHLDELLSSGIDTIPTNYQSVNADEASKLTGHKLEGLVIYYHAPDQQHYHYKKNGNKWGTHYTRIKPNWDRIDEKTKEAYRGKSGKLPKYLSPSKAGIRPYFSLFQDWSRILKSTFNSIDITEGEKKADKACLEGFPTIGLPGVTCFQDKRFSDNFEMGSSWDTDEPQESNGQSTFLEELDDIEWKYRSVGICFDSDIVGKFPVKSAMVNLANQLRNRGAFPFPIFLPNELDGSKNGLDDFLVRHGVEAYKIIRESCKRLQNSPYALLQQNKATKSLYIDDLEPNSLLKGILAWAVLKEHWAYRPGIGWYKWAKTHWQFASEEELQSEITYFMDAQGWVQRSCNLLTFLTKDLKNRVQIPEIYWNAANKLCFRNGTLNVETNQFSSHNRQDFLTSCLDYDYNQLAKCPVWESFLSQAMGGDRNLVELLRAWLKWILYPKSKNDRIELEKTLDLIGRKGTGKGTFLDVLLKLIGEGNYGSASPEIFDSPVGLGQLVDKKIAIDTDSSGFLKSVGTFNRVVTNEPVAVKRLYKDVVNLRLGVVIVRAYNDFIRVPSSGSEGLDRRLCIVPFNHAPDQIDVNLSSKLSKELTGIFQWAWSMNIEEAKIRILNAGQSPQVAELCQERFIDTHPEFNWVINRFWEKAYISAEDCYKEYKEWAESNGYHQLSHKSLRVFLDNLGVLNASRQSSGMFYSIAPMSQFNLTKYLGVTMNEPVQETTQEAQEEKVLQWKDVMDQINHEVKRLKWTKEIGKAYLEEHYQVHSRLLLNDVQIVEFLETLRAMPTPISELPIAKTKSGKEVYISFAWATEQLMTGQKTVTRRDWQKPWADEVIKAYKQGQKIAAYDQAPRNEGAKLLGYITLTQEPYQEKLADMPESDLANEGFPNGTKEKFIKDFFKGSDQVVWVVRFEFHLLEG